MDLKKLNKFLMTHHNTIHVITTHRPGYENNLFFDEVRRGINIEANLQHINVQFLFGFDHDATVFENSQGIIFAPDGSRRCKDIIDSIHREKEIPIVQFDNEVLQEEYAPYYDAFIGIDNYYGGKITAEYLMNFTNKNANVLVISGNKNLHYLSYNKRLEGFRDASQDFFNIDKIIYGEFQQSLCYQRLKEYMSSITQLPDIIFSLNDDGAIIAQKIIRELGISKNIIVSGFDGSVAGRAAMSKGDLVCSYDQNPEQLGSKSLQTLINIINRKPYKKIHYITSRLITKSNIGHTFYAGVNNFLDRSLTPHSFRKRDYEITDTSNKRHIDDYKKHLICPIYIDDINNIPKVIKKIDVDKFIIVSDNNHFLKVERKRLTQYLKEEGLKVQDVEFRAGENNKNPTILMQLIDDILSCKITKKSCLLLLGGGITANIGGLAASLLYRGIRFIHICTTLMNMADVCIGGKQAVDSRFGKNSIGNFWEPECIFIDTQYLQTLPERELQNGLAECIKHALCQNQNFYNFLTKNVESLVIKKNPVIYEEVIRKTLSLKLSILEKDSYETNEGMVLIYGHTLGNAIESASNYRLLHGEAISIGMVAAAQISHRLGLASRELVEQHKEIFNLFGLPVTLPTYIQIEDIMKFLNYDKKYAESPMAFILLESIGKVHMVNEKVPVIVTKEVIEQTLQQLYT